VGGTQIVSEFRWNRRNKPEKKTNIITEMRDKIVAEIFGREDLNTKVNFYL
jgi:hypothetical protein